MKGIRSLIKLPDKPSELIRLALVDLKKCEEDSRYLIDMEQWHKPLANPKRCLVCLAGSVMAQTLGCYHRARHYWDDFEGENRRKICAVNHFRTGDVHRGLQQMKVPGPEEVISKLREENPDLSWRAMTYLHVPEYKNAKGRFLATMNQLVDALEKAGL